MQLVYLDSFLSENGGGLKKSEKKEKMEN